MLVECLSAFMADKDDYCCSVKRREEDAAGKDLQVADSERFWSTGADWGRNKEQQDVQAGRAVISLLHADST